MFRRGGRQEIALMRPRMVHINIGSNLGDRAALIERAVALISEAFAPAAIRRATPYESKPWGYDSPNHFLNLGICFESALAPQEIFSQLQKIERKISGQSHRNAAGAYIDRLIDIDLIAVGNHIENSAVLTLPHPRMHMRPFVLIPMAEIDPEWLHPLLQLSAADLARRAYSEGCSSPASDAPPCGGSAQPLSD